MIEARLRLARSAFALDVDLVLPARGVTAVFGPSGCGKTSLLRVIAGLEHAAGRVAIDGEVWQDDATDVFVPTHRRDIGYVFQDAALFPHLTVRRNLDYGRSRVAADRRRIAHERTIELLGIAPLLDRQPATLSGGERQRVAIARALALSPRLLLMDEPLAALDAERKAEILPYLDRLHREFAMPVLYVSHALDEVARLADHLVLMEGGRTTRQGPLSDLLSRVDPPVRLGEEVGAVFEGTVAERDPRWHLARVAFDGGELWVRDGGAALGQRVRVRILARDVSVASSHHEDASFLNALPARVTACADEEDPALALVQLRMGGTPLLARLTRRSIDRLGLVPGLQVWAQIKAVALVD